MILLITIGCSNGYVYIPPITDVYIPFNVDAETDLIPYRKLRVTHFQADEPPPAYRVMKKKIAAASTIVVTAPHMIIDPVEVPSNPDSARWAVELEQLAWDTRFITTASWWNPKTKGHAIKRVLEHEQGHFAIAEREVRKENARIIETVARAQVFGSTPELVIVRVMRRVEVARKRVSDLIQLWNEKYDLETKNGSDEKAQREWTQLLQRQLKEMDERDQGYDVDE